MDLDIIYGPLEAKAGTPGTRSENGCVPDLCIKIINKIKILAAEEHPEHLEHQKNNREKEQPQNQSPPVSVNPPYVGWGLQELRAWQRCLSCEWCWSDVGLFVCLDQGGKHTMKAWRTCRYRRERYMPQRL